MNASDFDATADDSSYNFIYEKLVESEDDINGMIAYSLHKREKIEFIRSFLSKCTAGLRPKKSESLFIYLLILMLGSMPTEFKLA